MRAQVSVEFLIIFSVTLLALLVFMSISQSESMGMSMTKEKTDASNAVRTLGSAAQDVYSQGAGARKKVVVEFPPGYEANESYVAGNAIKIRASGNDFVEVTSFEVYGNLPMSPGKKEVWIVSEGGRVRIGNSLISADRETINIIMGYNDSRSDTITVANLGNPKVEVELKAEWEHPGILMGLSDTGFLLPGLGSDVTTVKFASPEDSVPGFYTGALNITGTDGFGNKETITIPLNVEVVRTKKPDGGPPLVVLPSMINETLVQGESVTKTFQVCTNTETTLDSVQFSTSEGWPGTWAGPLMPLAGIGAGSCRPKTLSVSVPPDAQAGRWSGYVYAKGEGGGDAEDVIVLDIEVQKKVDVSDHLGPLITDMQIYPSTRKIFLNDPVAVIVTADDSSTGNNSIASCEVNFNNGTYIDMFASDEEFNTEKESAGYIYYPGFSAGIYSATARCADANDNLGPERTEFFSVYQELLFVTKDGLPSFEEQAWLDFLDTKQSGEGFAWTYDVVDSAAFLSGSPNLSLYTAVAAERFVPGMEARLGSYDGSLIMLGHALENGTALLGSSSSSTISADGSNVNFVDPGHYITEGVSGKLKIADSNQLLGRFEDFYGSILVSGPGIPAGFHVLGVHDNRYYWGATNPGQLNEFGINASIRVFDHALNASSGEGE